MRFFKKVTSLIITLSTIVVCFMQFNIFVHAEEATEQETNVVQTASAINGLKAVIRKCTELNIREKPNDSSNILGSIPEDTEFTILDQEGKWFKIEYGELSGYVNWEYFKFVEPQITEDSNLLGNSIIHYKSNNNRDNNMSIACSKIDGTILQPGESFVWSEIIGQTYKKDGI